ncbi:MAG: STAS domain-containing protein [Gammaproteobacteria bacterium]|jgi:anti-sigma B factor antagonist|nr:STAS domain-containing protein [Gammaproteobacteria bacterium]
MRHTFAALGGYAVIGLRGEIDMHSSPEARRLILECIHDGRPTLVDLADVAYIDSSGVASLVEGFQLARTRGLDFGLVGVSGAVLNVLRLARLDKVFPIYGSVQERVGQGNGP